MNKEFESYALNPDGMHYAARISISFDKLLTELKIFCPPGRELSIAATKLEEACFFAKKAMSTNPDHQEVPTPCQ
jgi:hypothetical protein